MNVAPLSSSMGVGGSGRSTSSGCVGVAFVFSGVGSEYDAMWHELATSLPLWRTTLLTHVQLLADMGFDLREHPCAVERVLADKLLPLRADPVVSAVAASNPFLSSLSIGLLQLVTIDVLARVGVRPRWCLGHSLGEVAALHASGLLPLEVTLQLLLQRTATLHQLQASGQTQGAMMAVLLPDSDQCGEATGGECRCLDRLLDGHASGAELDLAASNAAHSWTLSGPAGSMDTFETFLRSGVPVTHGVKMKRLPVTIAYHSRALDALRDEAAARFHFLSIFHEEERQQAGANGSSDVASNSGEFLSTSAGSGGLIIPAKAKAHELAKVIDDEYWFRQIRGTVDFRGALQRLFAAIAEAQQVSASKSPAWIIEIGPRTILRSFVVKAAQRARADVTILGSCLEPDSSHAQGFFGLLARLSSEAGIAIDYAPLFTKAEPPPGPLEVPTPAFAKIEPQPISVVGMALRAPGGVDTSQQLFEVLASGRSLVGSTSNSGHVKPLHQAVGGVLTVEQRTAFNHTFFHLSAREAAQMDVSQRMLLQLVWEAFADAGVDPATLRGSNTGVFVGAGSADRPSLIDDRLDLPECSEKLSATESVYGFFGMEVSVVANRVSHFFDFRGPSFTVDTACSSSALAVHLACQSLRSGECEWAIVAGANGLAGHIDQLHPGLARGGMQSSTGHSAPFSADVDGYVRGEGYAVLLLRRGGPGPATRCYAELVGSGSNNNGHTSTYLSRPSVEGWSSLMRTVLERAHVSPEQISYVEAHATSTKVGDPIEAQALVDTLATAMRKSDQLQHPLHLDVPARLESLRVGSVKSTIGHLEWAAGIFSLIKVCLMLDRECFLPTLNFTGWSAQIPEEVRAHLYVQTSVESLTPQQRHIMQVNSSGMGGSNCILLVKQVAPLQVVDRQVESEASSPTSSTDSTSSSTSSTSLLVTETVLLAPALLLAHTAGSIMRTCATAASVAAVRLSFSLLPEFDRTLLEDGAPLGAQCLLDGLASAIAASNNVVSSVFLVKAAMFPRCGFSSSSSTCGQVELLRPLDFMHVRNNLESLSVALARCTLPIQGKELAAVLEHRRYLRLLDEPSQVKVQLLLTGSEETVALIPLLGDDASSQPLALPSVISAVLEVALSTLPLQGPCLMPVAVRDIFMACGPQVAPRYSALVVHAALVRATEATNKRHQLHFSVSIYGSRVPISTANAMREAAGSLDLLACVLDFEVEAIERNVPPEEHLAITSTLRYCNEEWNSEAQLQFMQALQQDTPPVGADASSIELAVSLLAGSLHQLFSSTNFTGGRVFRILDVGGELAQWLLPILRINDFATLCQTKCIVLEVITCSSSLELRATATPFSVPLYLSHKSMSAPLDSDQLNLAWDLQHPQLRCGSFDLVWIGGDSSELLQCGHRLARHSSKPTGFVLVHGTDVTLADQPFRFEALIETLHPALHLVDMTTEPLSSSFRVGVWLLLVDDGAFASNQEYHTAASAWLKDLEAASTAPAGAPRSTTSFQLLSIPLEMDGAMLTSWVVKWHQQAVGVIDLRLLLAEHVNGELATPATTGTLTLLQALHQSASQIHAMAAALDYPGPLPFVFLTRGCELECDNVMHALLPGFLRVARQELEQVYHNLATASAQKRPVSIQAPLFAVDLPLNDALITESGAPLPTSSLYARLLIEWMSGRWGLEYDTVLRLRDDSSLPDDLSLAEHMCCYVPRLMPMAVASEVVANLSTTESLFSPVRGSYLLTGASGGLAADVARWLVRNGAAHLHLVSRSTSSRELQRVAAELRIAKVVVHLHECDCADAVAMEAIFASAEPPISGVFHLANTFETGLVTTLRPHQFADGIRSKIGGAMLLHTLTSPQANESAARYPVDFLFFFSSLASQLGPVGSCIYSAANHVVDALAAHRHRGGFPTFVVNPSGVADAGYLAKFIGWRELRTLRRDGFKEHKVSTIHHAMERALRAQSAVDDHCLPNSVMFADWSAYHARSARLTVQHLYGHLTGATFPNGP